MKIIRKYLYSECANSISYRMYGFVGMWPARGSYLNRAVSLINSFLVCGARYTAYGERCKVYGVRRMVHIVRCAVHGACAAYCDRPVFRVQR